MDFGTALGGITQGIMQGIDMTNRFNEMQNVQDEREIRKMQMDRLKAPYDPTTDFPGYEFLPAETQKQMKDYVSRNGGNRMAFQNFVNDISTNADVMSNLMGASLNAKKMKFEARRDQYLDMDEKTPEAQSFKEQLMNEYEKIMPAEQQYALWLTRSKLQKLIENAPAEYREQIAFAAQSGDPKVVMDTYTKIVGDKDAIAKLVQGESLKHYYRMIENNQKETLRSQRPEKEKQPSVSDIMKFRDFFEQNKDSITPETLPEFQRIADAAGYEIVQSPTRERYNWWGTNVPFFGSEWKPGKGSYALKEKSGVAQRAMLPPPAPDVINPGDLSGISKDRFSYNTNLGGKIEVDLPKATQQGQLVPRDVAAKIYKMFGGDKEKTKEIILAQGYSGIE